MASALKTGARGPDVKKLQTDLNNAGAKPKLKPDGQFGPTTEEAVKAFQKQNKLKPDGIAGRDTMQKLEKAGGGKDAKGADAKSGKDNIKGLDILGRVDKKLQEKVIAFAAKYGPITVTDGKRTLTEQAKLMAPMPDKQLNMYGKGKSPYVVDIKKLDKKERTVKKVEEILGKYWPSPCYISLHLAGKAVDISMKGGFDRSKAAKIAAEVGLKVNNDPAEADRNCFHVNM